MSRARGDAAVTPFGGPGPRDWSRSRLDAWVMSVRAIRQDVIGRMAPGGDYYELYRGAPEMNIDDDTKDAAFGEALTRGMVTLPAPDVARPSWAASVVVAPAGYHELAIEWVGAPATPVAAELSVRLTRTDYISYLPYRMQGRSVPGMSESYVVGRVTVAAEIGTGRDRQQVSLDPASARELARVLAEALVLPEAM